MCKYIITLKFVIMISSNTPPGCSSLLEFRKETLSLFLHRNLQRRQKVTAAIAQVQQHTAHGSQATACQALFARPLPQQPATVVHQTAVEVDADSEAEDEVVVEEIYIGKAGYA